MCYSKHWSSELRFARRVWSVDLSFCDMWDKKFALLNSGVIVIHMHVEMKGGIHDNMHIGYPPHSSIKYLKSTSKYFIDTLFYFCAFNSSNHGKGFF